MKELIFPTNEHKEYILMLEQYCKENGIGLFIFGSVANGTAKRHSDIDVVLVSNNLAQHIDELSNIYANPVMKNVTENPKGILVLIFKSGLCIDMDLRERIYSKEVSKMVEVVSAPKDLVTDDFSVCRSNLPYLLYKNELERHNELRLIHRSLIKYLNGKFNSANSILNELKDSVRNMQLECFHSTNAYLEDMKNVLDIYSSHYNLNSDFLEMINDLIIECEETY